MDRSRIEAFLDKFIGLAAGASTIGLLAVADRSGISAWLGENESGTADEIATGAGLQDRYVLEIMSGLAAAGVVEYDADRETFHMPPEHALFLASEKSPYFMGGWLDMIPSAMAQVDAVTEATVNGGGVGFEEFGGSIIKGIDRGNGPSQRVFLTSRWLPAVEGLVDDLNAGIHVADIGAGAGTAALLIANAFPESSVVGFDSSEASLELARERAGDLANLRYEEASAHEIPIDPPFGLITAFDVIHDLADPQAGLRRIRNALSDDGVFLMMEPNMSSDLQYNLDDRGALMYGVSAMHCMTQSLAVGGEGLGAAWGREKAEVYCREAGFSSFAEVERISNRFSAFYEVRP